MANGPPDPSTTYRLVELEHATLEALRRRAAKRISLVVYHTDGVETALLSPGTPLVVGRAVYPLPPRWDMPPHALSGALCHTRAGRRSSPH